MFTPEQTMHMIRSWFFGVARFAPSQYVRYLLSLTERTEEHQWLVETLGDVPDLSSPARKLLWVKSVMRNNNDPRAKYYFAMAHNYDFTLLRESAEAGFPPAMYEHGKTNSDWMQKALELGSLDAFGYSVTNFEQCKLAADRGHIGCMLLLVSNFRNALSDTESVTYTARYILSTGYRFELPKQLYVAGRELQDYDKLWPTKQDSVDRCIRMYQDVTSKARRAALYTVMCLRGILGRDVARLIGKYVYQTRGSLSE